MHRRGGENDPVGKSLGKLDEISCSPLDFLTGVTLAEKLIDLTLSGTPTGPMPVARGLKNLLRAIEDEDTRKVKLVVFGGGTGLSNIIGGDSRNEFWPQAPFQGIKELFPVTTSIVCTTDDGGSTGELRRDLPLIALGDLRHVLLSSIQLGRLRKKYDLTEAESFRLAATLHALFNYRFHKRPATSSELTTKARIDIGALPHPLAAFVTSVLDYLFAQPVLFQQLDRQHCLGNLLLAAAICRKSRSPETVDQDAYCRALAEIAQLMGAPSRAVLPCSTTPASLKILYANGVIVTGEYKSGYAQRGYPMDRVFVEFSASPAVPAQVREAISEADIILYAPGSLYTSLVPILQIPDIARAIRSNQSAIKLLIANLWIQHGETDIVREDPGRRFYISDLIRAYQRNIPGGIDGLFRQVMVMKMHDIPGSILQSYAVEEKVPIYFDRGKVEELGITPVEATIFSRRALEDRRVVQHDPVAVSLAVKTLWSLRNQLQEKTSVISLPCHVQENPLTSSKGETPDQRMHAFSDRLATIDGDDELRARLLDIFWRHRDIPLCHLDYTDTIEIVGSKAWSRSQEWDKVFSFYDPYDRAIKIRQDVLPRQNRFEVAFLVALGQSLLGDYAEIKQTLPITKDGMQLGKVYELTLRAPENRHCYFSGEELEQYLGLVRMYPASGGNRMYTRLVNGNDGFTPPGMLMGLTYAWYLDNRFSSHIEYKMAILRTPLSGLIPEQVKVFNRRRAMVDFFRKVVFRQIDPVYEEKLVGNGG